jgi:hypothetical protein
MQLFSADLQYFQKKLNQFFAHENFKNGPQKLLIIGPNLFFSQSSPAHSPELIFHIPIFETELSIERKI